MLDEHDMSSQTLDILRQGVWASLTGGWFYDPHQDVFSNTFHLYLWLFLLCLPFTIYVYFPPTEFLWYLYCTAITVVFATIKLINFGLHHMYDHNECIHEQIDDEWTEPKREDEGIELQVLNATGNSTECELKAKPEGCSLQSFGAEIGVCSTDIDSFESGEYQRMESVDAKQSSTIDLKADVHRKNSSESSEEPDNIQIVPDNDAFQVQIVPETTRKEPKRPPSNSTEPNLRKLSPPSGVDVNEAEFAFSGAIDYRRHSNFTQSWLGMVARPSQMTATGSLELNYIDKKFNQALIDSYFMYHNVGVRRIRSTALEKCCPPPALSAHPNSLEIIGGGSSGVKTKNPLPPPSNTLTRNQHLNLCPYYGSEIVYPIAEQSDEHQTSHGPDTDLDSMAHVSDSDYEENRGSRSPLLLRNIYLEAENLRKKMQWMGDGQSASSKDALLDNDNSNSSATPEIQDVRVDCDNDSEKKLSDLDSGSSTSVDAVCELRVDEPPLAAKLNKMLEDVEEGARALEPPTGAIKRRNCRRNRKKKAGDFKSKRQAPVSSNTRLGESENSLVELDLDWLFDDENEHIKYNKDGKSDWCGGRPTGCVEEDVSKVLQEAPPRSLGAIPKKRENRRHSSADEKTRKVTKSDSERSERHRRKDERINRNRSVKEYVSTQASLIESPVEGLECLVTQPRHRKLSHTRRHSTKPSVELPIDTYQEASSSGSNTELSTLLPPQTFLQAFLVSRREFSMLPVCLPNERSTSPTACPRTTAGSHHHKLKRSAQIHSRGSRGRMSQRDSAILTTLSSGHGTHCAKSFNDTSDGSVHCFQDEHGNWITYTFDEKGVGTANMAVTATTKPEWENQPEPIDNNSVSIIMDHQQPRQSLMFVPPRQVTRTRIFHHTMQMNLDLDDRRMHRSITDQVRQRMITGQAPTGENNPLSLRDIMLNPDLTRGPIHWMPSQTAADTLNNNNPRTKSYYKFRLFPFPFVKVKMDRLKLMALLDRNLTLFETLVASLLGILVSVFGALLLYLQFYTDLHAFIFCFIIAGSQYSLMKSVQPDAASPTHGFNRVIAYSRPIYFCLFCGLILLIDACIDEEENFTAVSLYGMTLTNNEALILTRNFLVTFILFFPLLFSLGLFPQINTFLLYVLEQIDMHVFGGNAMSSLWAAFYCIFRSVLAVTIMYGLAYGGLCEPKGSQHVLFSLFCACLVSCSYHLSRSASDPTHVWNILKKNLWPPDIYKEHKRTPRVNSEDKLNESGEKTKDTNIDCDDADIEKGEVPDIREADSKDVDVDPLPKKLQKTVNARLTSDVLLCGIIAILVFGIHASTVFTALQPELSPVLWGTAAAMGFLLHYIIPQMRKQLPWLCIARPVLRALEHDQYQVRGPAKIMWFERVFVYLCFIERNILYPLLFLAALTEEAPKVAEKFGTLLGALIVVVCGLKCVRNSYSDQGSQYLILTFTALFSKYDYSIFQESFLVDYFLMGIIYSKTYELLLKVQFVVTYIAPWQITWGSAFHAFAQPFSVPHSAMLFAQAIISAILSTPLNPFLGSAIFLTSYVRPVKFWERDYNTRRVDHSNTPLSSHLERNLGADDNNLNSIFYEHLTQSLQHSLAGDLIMGRWGPISQGDCFVLASDNLNCLVHIIELGNGLVTFQMRGLEFRGTYCQQREVEAITEGVEENDGCCCCDPGHLPGMLSANAAFSQRWLAWEVTAAKYVLEGYSISDNSAVSMLQVIDFRKVLVTYYVKSIIFYAIRSSKLDEWLNSSSIMKALEPMQDRNFVDLDPVFNFNFDEDFDLSACGMTRSMFFQVYSEWIAYCVNKNEKNVDVVNGSNLVLLCFALSLLGRRTLSAASHNTVSSVEFFLHGLHALFKGDFRITCARDEWVFIDMDLIRTVVAPGVRMSLKLHQDHFMAPDEYDELPALYEAICKHEEELVISHEGDPAWRSAVLSGTPSLLALRHVLDEGNDEYKIIMLNKRFLSFRVIKINKECVRGLWAGQQQELVYLRNRNPERGSIQNAKQALRNIINSSCDQPIGYPIYVSPLTTSYAETNEQLNSLVGGSLSLGKIHNYVLNLFRRIRKRCGEGCSSGGSARDELGIGHEGVYAMAPVTTLTAHNTGSQSTDGSHLCGSIGRGSSLSRTSLAANRGSLASMGKPTSSTLANLAGLFKDRDDRMTISQQSDKSATSETQSQLDAEMVEKDAVLFQRVKIVDPNLVYDGINKGRRIDVCWPNEGMRHRGGRSYWNDWCPEVGMEGLVVHKWIPSHRDLNRRSHVDRTILLVQIDDKYIPIGENGVQLVAITTTTTTTATIINNSPATNTNPSGERES